MSRRDALIGRLRLAIGVLVIAFVALAQPSTARAETLVVVTSSPGNGATVDFPPSSISIHFNGPIGSAVNMAVTCNGAVVAVPSAKTSTDQLSMVLDLSATPLPAGNCAVDWQAQSLDGQVTASQLTFKITQSTAVPAVTPAVTAVSAAPTATVAPAGATTTDGTAAAATSPPADGPLFLSRLLSSFGLAALFGALVLIATAWPEGVEYILTIRFIRSAWIVAMVASIGVVVSLTAESTGKSFSASLSPTAWLDLSDTLVGKAALARLLCCAGAGWVAIRPERVVDPATQLPSLALPGVAVATMAFSRSGGEMAVIGYAAGLVHGLAMAVWFGGIVLLARVVLSGPGEEDLVHATRGFSRLATPALALTVVSGALQMYRLDRGHLFDSHGQVLMLKVLAVIAVVFVGVATRQFVAARLNRVDVLSAAMASRLRRAVGMEAIGGGAILLLSAWMLALAPGNYNDGNSRPNNYAFSHSFIDAKGTNDVTVLVTPARVGANAVFIDIGAPAALTSIVVRFDPPPGSTANIVELNPQMTMAGMASLPLSEGVPLGASGGWTMTVSVLTPEGEFRDSTNFTVSEADGTVPTVAVTPVTLPQVTIVVDPAATTTSVPSG